jgi:hypothetical protein
MLERPHAIGEPRVGATPRVFVLCLATTDRLCGCAFLDLSAIAKFGLLRNGRNAAGTILPVGAFSDERGMAPEPWKTRTAQERRSAIVETRPGHVILLFSRMTLGSREPNRDESFLN